MADEKKDAFKLSFGPGSSKHRQKRIKVNEQEDKPVQEYVTGFTEAGLTLRDGEGAASRSGTKAVIPNLGNDLRGLGPKAFNPQRFLPEKNDIARPEEGSDRFEVAAPEQRPEVKYGLSTFNEREEASTSAPNGLANGSQIANGRPQPRKGKRVIASGQDWETEAYQNDVNNLPEQSSLEEYEAMPVEAFGAAMLRGMGWSEDAEAVQVQAKEFVRRAPLLGLGASALPQSKKEKRFIKPGESREQKQELVVYDNQGNIKHTRTADEKLVPRVALGPAVGKTMRIAKGRHAGLLCFVKLIHPEVKGHSQKAEVRLVPSEELVTVRLKDLTEKDEAVSSSPQEDTSTAIQMGRGETDGQEQGLENGRQQTGEVPWLAPHIRVKVIDKHIGKGRLYLKKGEVVDVMTPTLCSLFLDSGEKINASQHQLETVIPKKEGARLLVVVGGLRGRKAKLLKRSTESSKAAIQLLEDFSIHRVSFDEISEFLGDYGEEE